MTAKIAAAGGPADHYVTRVFASPHKDGTAFVPKTGWHRDDYTPFVFRTDDFGDTWTAIGKGLPDGTVYAFAQDRKNADLLFVGSEMGVFATLDAGKTWAPFGTGLPPYPIVHDLLIHPRENDLVVATHSRGIFVADITPLQEADGGRSWRRTRTCSPSSRRSSGRGAPSAAPSAGTASSWRRTSRPASW